MAKLLSPGVKVTETDVSQVVSIESASIACFAGNFKKGPVGYPILIDSVVSLKENFGYPDKFNYNDWYQCYNFLQYANTLLVSRASNLNGDLLKTELKYVDNKFKLNENKDKKTIKFFKQSSTEVTFEKTDIFEVNDVVSFMENPKKFKVKYKRDDQVTKTSLQEAGVDVASMLTENVDVTIVTFDVAPEIDKSTEYLYKITDAKQPDGNLICFEGKNNLEVGSIFGLTDSITDPQFRVLEINQENVDGKIYTNIKYIGKDDEEHLVSASGGEAIYKLERTQSAVVEIPSTYKEYDVSKYDKVEHTLADFNTFDELKNSLAFVNEDAILKIFAKTPGAWGNNIKVAIANSDDFEKSKEIIDGLALDSNFEYYPQGGQFAIVVLDNNEIKETFTVSLDEKAKNDMNESIYIENVVNNKSSYIRVNVNEANPERKVASMLGNQVAKLTNGQDSNPGRDDIIEAYNIFDNKEEMDVDIIISNETYPQAAIDLALKREDAIAIIGSPRNVNVGLKQTQAVDEIVKWRKSLNVDSSFVALYANYKYQYCAEMDKFLFLNVSGDIAGVYAEVAYKKEAWLIPQAA